VKDVIEYVTEEIDVSKREQFLKSDELKQLMKSVLAEDSSFKLETLLNSHR
jgi:hypothetical protein